MVPQGRMTYIINRHNLGTETYTPQEALVTVYSEIERLGYDTNKINTCKVDRDGVIIPVNETTLVEDVCAWENKHNSSTLTAEIKVPKVVRKFYRDGVEYKIKFDKSWKPGANTVAYYPLTSTSTVNDMSGNNYTLTNVGKVSFQNYGGVDCAYFNAGQSSGASGLYRDGGQFINQNTTVSMRIKRTDNMIHNPRIIGTPNDNGWCFYVYDTAKPTYKGYISIYDASSGIVTNPQNNWIHLVLEITNYNSISAYVNGELKQTYNRSITNNTGLILGSPKGRTQAGDMCDCYMSNVIIENKARTEQEISDYYNNTKSNYGL